MVMTFCRNGLTVGEAGEVDGRPGLSGTEEEWSALRRAERSTYCILLAVIASSCESESEGRLRRPRLSNIKAFLTSAALSSLGSISRLRFPATSASSPSLLFKLKTGISWPTCSAEAEHSSQGNLSGCRCTWKVVLPMVSLSRCLSRRGTLAMRGIDSLPPFRSDSWPETSDGFGPIIPSRAMDLTKVPCFDPMSTAAHSARSASQKTVACNLDTSISFKRIRGVSVAGGAISLPN